MWKDQEHPAAEPAAETLKLAADPWAFWFILQSQFLNCSQPAASRPKAKAKRSQISFLAQRKEGQSWPTDTTLSEALKPLGLKVEFSSIYEKSMIGTGSILRNETADIGPGDHASPDDLLEKQVSALASLRSHFDRLKIARPIKPQLREALAAIRTATGNDQIGEKVSSGGSGIVVGFVDNGCAFAHPNFIKKDGNSYRSRVERIWDQSYSRDHPKEWGAVEEFGYGGELDVGKYDLRTGEPCGVGVGGGAELTEDQLYDKLSYELREDVVMDGMYGSADFTHGTHIMDIAVGANGVAPDADIIFVQLPQSAISENTDQASARHILDGVAYIFKHAGKRPAVVNISYNAYTGPHDGTSLLELGLDELLKPRGRAVVISAGNARDANCHEFRSVPAKQCLDGEEGRQPLLWSVHPDDPTENFMEIWYEGGKNLQISVISPDGKRVANAVGPDRYSYLKQGCSIMGAVIHRANDPGNNKNQVLIALNPTAEAAVSNIETLNKPWSPAASGVWRIEVSNQGETAVAFHARIERDDRGENPVVEQSHFLTPGLVAEGEEEGGEEFGKATKEEMNTLGGFCTGENTIIVGAYNLATKRPMPFSSLGPTEHEQKRPKPDIYAPGASDPGGEGIEAASARSANLIRLTGTSVAAPFVAGLIARRFSEKGSGWLDLDTKQIIEKLQKGGEPMESPDGGTAYAIKI